MRSATMSTPMYRPGALQSRPMLDASDSPANRLRRAREAAGFVSARSAALRHGWPESTYRAYEAGTRRLHLEAAETYADAFKVETAWLMMREEGTPLRKLKLTMPQNAIARREPVFVSSVRLKVLGFSAGGTDGRFLMNGEPIDHVMCPPGLENVPGAYAVYIVGDSMEPRYFAGEIVYVHPNKPCRKGTFVVVQVRNPQDEAIPLGYVKQFISLTPTRLVLRQYQPDKEIEFPRKDVISVHRIVLGGDQ